MKYLLAAMLALTAAPAAAQQADAAYGVTYQLAEIDLPQDQGKPYLTLFGDEKDARFQRLRSWFANHDRLRDLKEQTHYSEVTGEMLRRYDMRHLPCVRLQRADGTVEEEITPDEIPMTAEAMANAFCRRSPIIEPATPPPPASADHPYILLAALTIAAGIASAVQQLRTKGIK